MNYIRSSILVLVIFTFFALLMTSVFAQAQDPFLDTVAQQATPGNIEHNSYRREYQNAMTPGAQGIPYWAEPALVDPAATAVAFVNAGKPLHSENAYSVPFENSTEDLKIRYGNCTGEPGAFGCFNIDYWYNFTALYPGFSVWQKATMYLKPDQSNSRWTASSLRIAIAHELMHGYGLNDQYLISGGTVYCNGSVNTIMDAFGTDGSGNRYHCDNTTPALKQWEKDRWVEYKTCCNYVFDYYSIWGDGTVTTYWRDRAWSDFRTRAAWQWNNNGTWTNFIVQDYQNYNGSHQNVTQAVNLRIHVWENPSLVGINQKYIRVCTVPIYNTYDVGSWVCTNSFFYPY